MLRGTSGDGIAVEGDGDRTLEEFDGDDETLVVLDAEDAAIQAGEGAGVDANGLAFAQECEWAEAAAGIEDAFEGLDFGNWDGFGAVAEADEADCSGDGDDFERGGGGEAAEEVAGEEWAVDGFNAVGPAAVVGIEGEERFDSVGAQNAGDGLFGVRFDAESEPFLVWNRH
jgi:hypothetical protein